MEAERPSRQSTEEEDLGWSRVTCLLPPVLMQAASFRSGPQLSGDSHCVGDAGTTRSNMILIPDLAFLCLTKSGRSDNWGNPPIPMDL